MTKHLQNVSADYIRYANCWEDADVLCEGLNLQQNSKVLSIASAGDNTFSLLTANPELVVAADLNSAQLNLMRLKIAAISELNHEEYLSFSGFTEGIKRVETYLKIRSNLSAEARNFWDSKKQEIETGIIFCGKFEKVSFETAIISISEIFLLPSLSTHFIEFIGKDESCLILFPSLSSATAPINFPFTNKHAEESE